MGINNDEFWMQEALRQAHRAAERNEVPIGAVLIYDGNIIGTGHNQPISTHDPTAHAEIVALRQAAVRLGNYRLPETVLYVTLEPCAMCAGALVSARVSRVVFGAGDSRNGACGSVFNILQSEQLNHRIEVVGGVMAEECAGLLRGFFRSRR